MSDKWALRHDGELAYGEERRGYVGVAASNGSPLPIPRHNGEGDNEPTHSSLTIYLIFEL